MTCEKEIKTYSPIECYYCGHLISDYNELAYLNVDLKGNKNKKIVQRAVHYYCVPKIKKSMQIEQKRVEKSHWDKCYALFKEWKDIKTENLDQYSVNRLLGLRINKFTPKGNNTLGLKSGYDFDVIFATMQFVNHIIMEAKRTVSFVDDKHQTNYFMKVIIGQIDFMSNRMSIKKQEESKLDIHIQNISNQQEQPVDLSHLKQGVNNDLILDVLDTVSELDGDSFDDVFE